MSSSDWQKTDDGFEFRVITDPEEIRKRLASGGIDIRAEDVEWALIQMQERFPNVTALHETKATPERWEAIRGVISQTLVRLMVEVGIVSKSSQDKLLRAIYCQSAGAPEDAIALGRVMTHNAKAPTLKLLENLFLDRIEDDPEWGNVLGAFRILILTDPDYWESPRTAKIV